MSVTHRPTFAASFSDVGDSIVWQVHKICKICHCYHDTCRVIVVNINWDDSLDTSRGGAFM